MDGATLLDQLQKFGPYAFLVILWAELRLLPLGLRLYRLMLTHHNLELVVAKRVGADPAELAAALAASSAESLAATLNGSPKGAAP